MGNFNIKKSIIILLFFLIFRTAYAQENDKLFPKIDVVPINYFIENIDSTDIDIIRNTYIFLIEFIGEYIYALHENIYTSVRHDRFYRYHTVFINGQLIIDRIEVSTMNVFDPIINTYMAVPRIDIVTEILYIIA